MVSSPSPLFGLVTVGLPTTPMKSPRSTFFHSSNAASPIRSLRTQTWISPVRSSSFTNAALPKPR